MFHHPKCWTLDLHPIFFQECQVSQLVKPSQLALDDWFQQHTFFSLPAFGRRWWRQHPKKSKPHWLLFLFLFQTTTTQRAAYLCVSNVRWFGDHCVRVGFPLLIFFFMFCYFGARSWTLLWLWLEDDHSELDLGAEEKVHTEWERE